MNGVQWLGIVRRNASYLTARSPSGTGAQHPVSISVDGIVSVNDNLTFSYLAPNISSVTAPPFRGGTVQVQANELGTDVGKISVQIDDGACSQDCTSIELVTNGLQCVYSLQGAKGACRGVIVAVNGQQSNRYQFCYDVDTGEVTGLPRGLQSVNELESLQYTVSLSLPELEVGTNVQIQLSANSGSNDYVCTVSPLTISFYAANGTASQQISVLTVGNFIDEGHGATMYTCSIRHVITSTDPQYSTHPERTVDLKIVNDDNADVKLWTINEEDNTYDYDVKFVGPLSIPEGNMVAYGVRLDTQPRADVTIFPNITLNNADKVAAHPILNAEPAYLVFGASNWSTIQRLELRSGQDNIDNDKERFQILHNVITTDTVLFQKSTVRPILTVLDVTDDDTAGIVLEDNALVEVNEGVGNQTFRIVGLATQSLHDVTISISASSNLIVVTPSTIVVEKNDWQSANKVVAVAALDGDYDVTTNFDLTIRSSSVDPKYVNKTERKTVVVTPKTIVKGEVTGVLVGVQNVIEANNLTYSIGLSRTPLSSVEVVLQVSSANSAYMCALSETRLVFSPSDALGATKPIILQTSGNLIDEGTNAILYKCDVSHTINSADPQYSSHSDISFSVSIVNDDNADVKLWTINEEDNTYDYDVKFVGPLSIPEGNMVAYGVRLDTQPRADVTIFPNITLNNADKVAAHPILNAEPAYLVFGASNWSTIQRLELRSGQDNIDNDKERFQILHNVITTDTVLFQKSTVRPILTVLDVTDDDTAGIVLEDNALVEVNEGVGNQTFRIVGLATQSLHDVTISISASSNLIVVTPSTIVVEKNDWQSANKVVAVAALDGDYDVTTNFDLTIRSSSVDPKYVNKTERKTVIVEVNDQGRQIAPPRPGKPSLNRGSSLRTVKATWSSSGHLSSSQAFEVQWSEGDDTFATGVTSVMTMLSSILINSSQPLTLNVVYVRVRMVGKLPSPWSPVSNMWQIAKQCHVTQQYLNSSGNFDRWRCDACPAGAWCEGLETTWEDVKPLFGWWRNNIWREDAASNFTQCSYPPACLGARNFAFKGKYTSPEEEDVAIVHRNESCNTARGYASVCSRRGDERCRLCATCGIGYRRLDGGSMQCAICPPTEANWALMSVGVVAVFAVVAFMVVDHMVSGGTIDVPNMRQIIVINYFQLTYMIAGTNVAWPDALKVIFDIEGAVSTIGEHLFNPACELTTIPAAEIMYSKQIAYLLVLPGLVLLLKALWWLLAKCQGRGYRYRGVNRRSPSHKDGSVATIVYVVYLLYPTLCRQAFALLICKKVDGLYYLEADMQEQCYVGRHLHYVLLCTIPQIALHVVGLPLKGLIATNRARKKRAKMHFSISLFRYGMLYSPYGPKRWFWEAVIASRKAMIVLVTSLFEEGVEEVHWLILFLSISIIGNIFSQPYIGAVGVPQEDALALQRFDSLSLFVLLVTAWSGVYFDINQKCGNGQGAVCSMLLVVVVSLNIAFLCYCLYHFRSKIGSAIYFVVDLVNCGKTKMVANRRKQSQRQNSRVKRKLAERQNSAHMNPLVYRATLVKEQVFENPVHLSNGLDQSMLENPLRWKKQQKKAAADAEWEKKVVEMRMIRSKSNANRRDRIKKAASFKLEAKRKKKKQKHPHVGSITNEKGNASKWTKALDPVSGNDYYCNIETGETVWERPSGFKERLDT